MLKVIENQEKTVIVSGDMKLPFNKTIMLEGGCATCERTRSMKNRVAIKVGDSIENEGDGFLTRKLETIGFERRGCSFHYEGELSQELMDLWSELSNSEHLEDFEVRYN